MWCSDDMTAYEILFDLDIKLCDRFRNLDPIKIRRYPSGEVFRLIRRLHSYNSKMYDADGNKKTKVYRKQATSWF